MCFSEVPPSASLYKVETKQGQSILKTSVYNSIKAHQNISENKIKRRNILT